MWSINGSNEWVKTFVNCKKLLLEKNWLYLLKSYTEITSELTETGQTYMNEHDLFCLVDGDNWFFIHISNVFIINLILNYYLKVLGKNYNILWHAKSPKRLYCIYIVYGLIMYRPTTVETDHIYFWDNRNNV